MADLPRYIGACLHTGKLAALAILVSGGIVLQILVSNIVPFVRRTVDYLSHLVFLNIC